MNDSHLSSCPLTGIFIAYLHCLDELVFLCEACVKLFLRARSGSNMMFFGIGSCFGSLFHRDTEPILRFPDCGGAMGGSRGHTGAFGETVCRKQR
jgi:hypothetical protein